MKLTLDRKFNRSAPKEKLLPALEKAAKAIVKELHDEHFNPKKKMGWPIDYNHIVADIFYRAFGHSLENYLLEELASKNCYFLITKEGSDRLLVTRNKQIKKKKVKIGKKK